MNNPLLYTDPSGYTWFTQFGGWLGKVGRPILETAVGISAGIAADARVAALTVGTGGLDLLAAGFIAGMVAGISTGILNTAFSGGSGDDYLNAIAQGGAYGGLTGFATSAVLYGICAGWQAIGNSDVASNLSPGCNEPVWKGRSDLWWVKIYCFINNIGNGGDNAAIISSTGGFMTSDEFASALAALGPATESGLNMNLFPRSTTSEIPEMQSRMSINITGSSSTFSGNLQSGYESKGGTLLYYPATISIDGSPVLNCNLIGNAQFNYGYNSLPDPSYELNWGQFKDFGTGLKIVCGPIGNNCVWIHSGATPASWWGCWGLSQMNPQLLSYPNLGIYNVAGVTDVTQTINQILNLYNANNCSSITLYTNGFTGQ